MQINIEYRHISGFETFFKNVGGKTVALMYDINTKPYALRIKEELTNHGCKILDVEYADEELIPSEDKCEYAYTLAKTVDYVLAVGSGTLNDMAKSVLLLLLHYWEN